MNTCSLEAKIAELQQENMMLHSLIAKSAKAAGMDADANPDCEFLYNYRVFRVYFGRK